MNLELARELLGAAKEQPPRFVEVKGREVAREVELLAEDGYVEAIIQPGATPPVAVINRLTTAGEKLLCVLRDEPKPSLHAVAQADFSEVEETSR